VYFHYYLIYVFYFRIVDIDIITNEINRTLICLIVSGTYVEINNLSICSLIVIIVITLL